MGEVEVNSNEEKAVKNTDTQAKDMNKTDDSGKIAQKYQMKNVYCKEMQI
jgi:hypothetical protein